MPLLPLPWQERTGEGTSQTTYSELMSRTGARAVSVSIKPGPEGETSYWDLHFGVGVSVQLYLTDGTVAELVRHVEAQRAWLAERAGAKQ